MKITALIVALIIGNMASGQVSVDRNLNLELAEKNEAKSKLLEKSLNGFLAEAQSRNFTSRFVDPLHQEKYEFFFAKLSGIGAKSGDFFNPTVLKSYSPDGEVYRLTVGFYGARDGNPFIYQMTELKAVPFEDHYRFYCPFEENTAHFNDKTFGTVTYHFSGDFDEIKAAEFARFKGELSALTDTQNQELDYYCFQDLDELLKSYGFLYSARQCNFLCYDLGFTDNGGSTYVTGTANENYIFGYVGDFLGYNLPDEEQMYRPIVEGLATYYGGYGLSYDNLDELKSQFRDELEKRPALDFLEEFKKGRKSSINRHFSAYVMGAFLCEDALNKGSFEGVLKLIYSGAKGESFFENLNDVLGIDEGNFHESMLRLIGT